MHRILAISGSLREQSSSTLLLKALAQLSTPLREVVMCTSPGALPHFNPDLDADVPPASVAQFRRQLASADTVVICTPEYAHGAPGVLKNALDWVVGSGELVGKAVVLINPSLMSTHAERALTETLTVMMATVTAIRIPVRRSAVDVRDLLGDADTRDALTDLVSALPT